MSNSSGPAPTAPMLPLLLLAAMAAGGFYLYEKPFESTRPPVEELETSFASEADSVPARLWEDPFTAVAEHLKANPPSEDDDMEQATDAALALTALQVLKLSESVSVRSGGGDNRNNKYGALEKRLLAKLREEFDGADRELVSDQKLKPLAKEISKSLSYHDVIVMPVMVRGGWYGEDVEQRRRRRYAVLSALGMEKYQPRYPERIHYFAWSGSEESSSDASAGFVPYEWFNPDKTEFNGRNNLDDESRVLVMWIAEKMFGPKPLKGLANLLASLKDEVSIEERESEVSHKAMRFKVIGPSSSEILQLMMWEASSDGSEGGEIGRQFEKVSSQPIEMYVPTATAEADILVDATRGLSQSSFKRRPAEECKPSGSQSSEGTSSIANYFKDIHIDFLRTNVGDGELAELIVNDEFERRRIFAHDPRHVVVLISEWDTFYGRALPKSFANILYEKRESYWQAAGHGASGSNNCRCGVCRYSYLRGLDGETPQSKLKETDAGTSSASREAASDREALERADGESQYDYLRRLAQSIKAEIGSKNIKAVGVLGTDVYDKLLALQALHDRFPRALFFTTDLDARYIHASAYPSTRNLVVASGFDLNIDLDEEIKMPPFRDSYQTATYFAVRVAIEKPNPQLCVLSRKYPGRPPWTTVLFQETLLRSNMQSKHACALTDSWNDLVRQYLQPWFGPKLFEVGSNKNYRLSEGKNKPSMTKIVSEKVSAIKDKLKDEFFQPITDIRAYASYKKPRFKAQIKTVSHAPLDSTTFATMVAMTEASEQPNGKHRESSKKRVVIPTDVLFHDDFMTAPANLQFDWALRILAGAWIIMAAALFFFLIWARYSLKALMLSLKYTCIGVAVVLPSLLLLGVVWLIQPVEPFAWWGGVSIWPAEAIRLFACTLSIVLLISSRRSLARNATGLDGRYVLWGRRAIDLKRRYLLTQDRIRRSPPRPSVSKYATEPRRRPLIQRILLPFGREVARSRFLVNKSADNKSYIDVCGLWRAYTDIHPEVVLAETGSVITGSEASRSAMWRIIPLALFFTMPLVIIELSSSNIIARGSFAYIADKCILVLVTGAFMALLLYVLNATLMCRRFIAHLVRRVSHYPPETLDKFANEHEMTKRGDDLADWLDVQLIANRTRVVATLIYWPILILLLLWFSYNQTFDGWHRPLIFYAILLLPALLMLVCQIALCREAEKGRRRALDRMDHKLSEAHAADDDKGRIEQLKLLIEEIEAIQEGAFRPLSQQPFLKAMLLPFASVGTIQALEYISMVGG